MNHLNDPVERLVRRFASLPPHARLKVAGSLLSFRDEQERTAREASGFLEQFWDEVEAAHGDGLYPTNPFAHRGALNLPQQRLVRLSC
ncbi:MAG TPA: hypothetical protein VGC87_25605 [Pyrinomonadaceae bacterium]